MNGYRGADRRSTELSDEQLDAIAERAAIRAVELLSHNDEFLQRVTSRTLGKINEMVGQGVLGRVWWSVGIGFVLLLGWLIKKGHLPI